MPHKISGQPRLAAQVRYRWGVVWAPFLLTSLALLMTAHAVRAQAPGSIEAQPFVVEQRITRYRFEGDGTGVEVNRLRVRLQSRLGLEAFGRLAFLHNADNQRLRVDYVRVMKPSGQVVDVDTSGIQDLSAAVAFQAPVYTDTRERHIPVPGLQLGDVLDYQWTTETIHPLAAGEFWASHQFWGDVAVVSESLLIDVPATRAVALSASDALERDTIRSADRVVYVFEHESPPPDPSDQETADDGASAARSVQLSSFATWSDLASWYDGLQGDRVIPDTSLANLTRSLIEVRSTLRDQVQAIYEYVSTRVRYVSISFGLGRFQPHPAVDVAANGYGDCKDKHTLLAAMLSVIGVPAYPALIHTVLTPDTLVPAPSQFDHMVSVIVLAGDTVWLDTTAEVAPFGLLSPLLRNRQGLLMTPDGARIALAPTTPPFDMLDLVEVDGSVASSGKLSAHVAQQWRGDSELILRSLFRATPRAAWSEALSSIVQAQEISGTVTGSVVSDTDSLADPFAIAYDLSNPMFVQWAGETTTMPVPLPGADLLDLNDEDTDASDSIPMGGPSITRRSLRLELPESVDGAPPTGIVVERPYATYQSVYAVDGRTVTAQRSLTTKVAWLPATARQDYQAFLRTIRADEDQLFRLKRDPNAPVVEVEEASVDELHQAGYDAIEADQYERAVQLLNRVVALDPNHLYGWNNLGRAYAALERYEEAVAAYRRQIEVNRFDQWAYNNLGSVLRRLGRHEEAIQAYRDQLAINPLDYTAIGSLGTLLVEIERAEEALPLLEQAIALKPDEAYAQFALVEALQDLGRFEEASERLRAVLPLASSSDLDSMPALSDSVRLGVVRQRVRAPLDVEVRESRQALPELRLASSLMRLERYDEAIEVLEQSVRDRPENARGHAMLGSAYGAAGRLRDAMEAMLRVVALDSSLLADRFGIHPDQTQHESAYQAASALAKDHPESAYAWAEVARFAFYTNRMEEAASAYRRVLRLNPAFLEFYPVHAELRKTVSDIVGR